ncbi:Modification methylase DpnIIB [Jeotgalibaca dankookensis]|uniref:Methyltransferase n=1 Tax=Jeotgalibaca dankookensis TaxID=708126 RepID=A0A1S6ILV2_9LACT|nr:site-specific DNA-methyltransferase [Jeotgalibaca dankookensis]AQS52520.1 Modification methylase DpnIIB [Jeotgalibaca dankookensis]
MEMRQLSLKELTPAEYNPRKNLQPGDAEYEKLKRSLGTFGYVDPIIWNQRTERVVGGHQRLKVLEDLGYETIDCVVVDLDEDKEKALNVALNKISGDWDKDKLVILISDLEATDFDVSLTGFDPEELDDLFKDDLKDGIEDDDFDVDEVLKEPTMTQQGDIWQLGRHRLVCGDSTKISTFEALMEGRLANLIVTDPPYNVNYEGKAGKIQNDNQSDVDFYQFLLDVFQLSHDVLADDGSIYMFHADTEGLNFRRAFKEAGFYLSGTCIWKKQSLVLGRSPYQWQHEPILFGWKKKGKHLWYNGRKESTIWEFDKPKKNGDHPTMKPVPLIAYPILNSSLTNGIVLDPFGGSGSTLIACEQTDRVCYTIELDEKYCDVIVKRYIKQVENSTEVTLIRKGKKYTYSDLLSSVSE